MIHLLDEKLLALQRRIEITLMPLTLDRHPQDIRGALEEREIMLDKLIFRSAVDLQYSEGLPVPLQDNVHGAVNAVFEQKLGRSEPLLVVKMIGDYWPAGFQRESRRRSEICADADDADDARPPTNAGPNKKAIFSRNVFEHLTKFSAKAFRR